MSGAGGRPTVGVGNHPAIDERHMDLKRNQAARMSCDDLLRAQLRTGQHLLPIALARAVGATLFMNPGTVRPAFGDPTNTEGAQA